MAASSSTRYGNGVGRGDGWGGPARGAGTGGDAVPFTADSPTRHAGQRDAVKMLSKAERAALKRQRVEALEDHLYKLAIGASREETQVQAATRLHAIYEGQPIARQITANVDDISSLSDEAIRDELARLGREEVDASARAAAEGLPN